MNEPWYELMAVKDKLTVFGRAIQGADPFDVVIEPDSRRCTTGYCNFSQRQIVVNPTNFTAPPGEQYLLTKALLVHEAGHRRYTTPTIIPAFTREIANILEDERVERRMYEEFLGVRWLIRKLTAKFYEEAGFVDHMTDDPFEVVEYFLQLRWANRLGQPVKGNLSLNNQLLWTMVKPLVYDAWQAQDTVSVDAFADEIADILGFNH